MPKSLKRRRRNAPLERPVARPTQFSVDAEWHKDYQRRCNEKTKASKSKRVEEVAVEPEPVIERGRATRKRIGRRAS